MAYLQLLLGLLKKSRFSFPFSLLQEQLHSQHVQHQLLQHQILQHHISYFLLPFIFNFYLLAETFFESRRKHSISFVKYLFASSFIFLYSHQFYSHYFFSMCSLLFFRHFSTFSLLFIIFYAHISKFISII